MKTKEYAEEGIIICKESRDGKERDTVEMQCPFCCKKQEFHYKQWPTISIGGECTHIWHSSSQGWRDTYRGCINETITVVFSEKELPPAWIVWNYDGNSSERHRKAVMYYDN